MKSWLKVPPLCVVSFILLVFIASGCASFQPRPLEQIPFLERAQTLREGDVTVTVSVLTSKESEQAFGTQLAKRGVEPVWLRIENREDMGYVFFTLSLDSEYFSPHEAAWAGRFFMSPTANQEMARYFYDQHIPVRIEPKSVVSGFMYTQLDRGMKFVNVHLVGDDTTRIKEIKFIVPDPEFPADIKKVDFAQLYSSEAIVEHDQEGLRKALASLPCCALGGDKKTPGDPLNLVVIGRREDVRAGFISRGWHLTETLSAGAAWNTIKSSLFRSRNLHSPISPLYVFDRPQDVALQKARATVDERNHLRLWLTPFRFGGKEVWVGQISRDIGVRFSSKTFVTHQIDPNVDETRTYLVMDTVLSQRVGALGYVKGVGAASPDEPRYNYTLDPYFTDGLRAVMVFTDKTTAIPELRFLGWEPHPHLQR